jgi:peptidyl-prolyl cis-trans isomerase C
MRSLRLGAALVSLALLPCGLHAQTPPPARPAGGPSPETVIARVNGTEIHLADLNVLMQTLPEEVRTLPPAQLYPQLLDQAIDGRALVILAKKQNLDRDPQVARLMQAASDRALQSALISK